MENLARSTVEDCFVHAGILIDGVQPFDIQVRDERFYRRLFLAKLCGKQSLAFGDMYMDGWWECAVLDEMICRLLREQPKKAMGQFDKVQMRIKQFFINPQSVRRSRRVAEGHYDLDFELFHGMLGHTLAYTCGYWNGVQTLDEAQEAKFDLICRKLEIKAGDLVLDIGCGWGGFPKFVAERYGARVTGVTISQEQMIWAEKLCNGIPGTDFRLMDYRLLSQVYTAMFDHVVSIGMFEHVGPCNYHEFMRVVSHVLKPGGKLLLHTIGGTGAGPEPWTEKYIFPGGVMPTLRQILRAADGVFQKTWDVQNFGHYYDATLMVWYANFCAIWEDLRKLRPEKYTDRFFRMWTYYLLSFAGAFRAGRLDLWQIEFIKQYTPGGYGWAR